MLQLIDPVMIFFLGRVVGFIVLACFLPIYKLISLKL